MSHRRPFALAAIAASMLLAASSVASAAGGSGGGGGGGGTSTSGGTIKVGASAAAACDNGSNLSVSISKGRSTSTQEQLVLSGNTAGYWMYTTVADATGQKVMSFGGNQNTLGPVSALITVQTTWTLPKGTWALTFTGTRADGFFDGPLLETCTAHMTVVVG